MLCIGIKVEMYLSWVVFFSSLWNFFLVSLTSFTFNHASLNIQSMWPFYIFSLSQNNLSLVIWFSSEFSDNVTFSLRYIIILLALWYVFCSILCLSLKIKMYIQYLHLHVPLECSILSLRFIIGIRSSYKQYCPKDIMENCVCMCLCVRMPV